ncbi:hypothetical protein AAX05_01215 [Moraxella bovoculi]|uniref:hypothetical protein n=1 Tax=Moraxella bovoculi TaxID=386891 RepID=UPI000624A73F|nr:hypothetical protein [Moraxella bovoculi]AKG09021.1 hypothetical protein AAX05_01215 [Moraxella bovoculi]
MSIIIEDLLIDMSNKQGWAVIYPDQNDDEKYAEIIIKFDYGLEYIPEDVEWLDGWKRVEPAEVNIVNIEFGEYSVIDGNHKPTTAEIEAVHAEMWLQIERTQREELWKLFELSC